MINDRCETGVNGGVMWNNAVSIILVWFLFFFFFFSSPLLSINMTVLYFVIYFVSSVLRFLNRCEVMNYRDYFLQTVAFYTRD